MERIVIELLQPEEIPEASALLGRAMCTNPVHVAVFQGQGEKERRCLEALFRLRLKHAPGRVLLAKDSGRIVGVMRMVEAPRCYPSPVQRLIQMSLMLTTLRGRLSRVLRWLSIWAKHDPKQPHWHLGPLGVLPEDRGRASAAGCWRASASIWAGFRRRATWRRTGWRTSASTSASASR